MLIIHALASFAILVIEDLLTGLDLYVYPNNHSGLQAGNCLNKTAPPIPNVSKFIQYDIF